MKPSTHQARSTARDSSPDTSTIRSITAPGNASGCTITVETTSARMTFDGSDPSLASAPSHVFPAAQLPHFLPLGSGTVIRWVSTAAAASIVQVTWHE